MDETVPSNYHNLLKYAVAKNDADELFNFTPEQVFNSICDYYYSLNNDDREIFRGFLYNFVWDLTNRKDIEIMDNINNIDD